MSRADEAAQRAYRAGLVAIPYPLAVELRLVVQCCTLGDQRQRLGEALDVAIERFTNIANIEAKVVSE